MRSVYLACVAFVDHQVGRVIEALDQGPHAGDTAIVLLSDHGYHLGEKDRVSKHSLWEESTRVPLVVVPASSQTNLSSVRGTRCSKPVGLIDLYPTALELCGLPKNLDNQGMSLVPLLNKPVEERWRFAILTTYAKDNHALRSSGSGICVWRMERRNCMIMNRIRTNGRTWPVGADTKA